MRSFVLSVLMLLATTASAQVFPIESAGYAGGAVTNPFLAPNGSGALPGYAFTLHPTWGMWANGAGVFLSTSTLDYLNSQVNLDRMHSQLGSDSSEISVQANYISSGDPIFTLTAFNSANSSSAQLFCTTRDADEGCTLTSNDGTVSSVTRFDADGTSFTDPVILPDGLDGAPAVAFTSEADVGLWKNGTGRLLLQSGPAADSLRAWLQIRPGDTTANGLFSANGTEEASVRLGVDTPSVTIRAADGANVASIVVDEAGSPAQIITTVTDGTDTSTITYDHLMGPGKVQLHQTGTSTLTETTATALVRFPITSLTFVNGTITLNTYCTDTTDFIMRRVEHQFVCYNAAGTEACTFTTGDSAEHATSGSISAHTIAMTGGTDTVDITLDTTCSLTQTTLESFWNIEFERGYARTATEQN